MTLNDDLLQDFKEQKQVMLEQIDLFDPLATSLRRPAAQRLMSKGGLIFVELVSYLFCLGAIALAVLMNLTYPFGPLKNVPYLNNGGSLSSLTEDQHLSIAVHALAGLTALLFFIIARMTRRIRLKNDILDLAGRNVKALMGQHLRRKASVEAIEQRHFLEFPNFDRPTSRVNNIPNPGYDNYDYSQ